MKIFPPHSSPHIPHTRALAENAAEVPRCRNSSSPARETAFSPPNDIFRIIISRYLAVWPPSSRRPHYLGCHTGFLSQMQNTSKPFQSLMCRHPFKLSPRCRRIAAPGNQTPTSGHLSEKIGRFLPAEAAILLQETKGTTPSDTLSAKTAGGKRRFEAKEIERSKQKKIEGPKQKNIEHFLQK